MAQQPKQPVVAPAPARARFTMLLKLIIRSVRQHCIRTEGQLNEVAKGVKQLQLSA